MSALVQILTRYGATSDFWSAAEGADSTAEQMAVDEFKSLVLGLPESDARSLTIRWAHESVLSGCPTGLFLAKYYQESGNSPAHARALETAYQSIMESNRDPDDLSRLGYLLLRECGVTTLPLCQEDFGGTLVWFGDGDELYVVPKSYDPKVPTVLESHQMEFLAVRAFGLTWLHSLAAYDSGITKHEAWREALALDGLRATFLTTKELDGLVAACDGFDAWLEDWAEPFQSAGLLGELLTNFGETRGYLRGLRDAASVVPVASGISGRDLLATRRLLAWQLAELQSEIRNKRISAEEISMVSEAIADKVAAHLKSAPYVTEYHEDQLEHEFGTRWSVFPAGVKRLLIQADYLRSVLVAAADADWAPVVLHYVRALETQLRVFGQRLDGEKFHSEFNQGYRFSNARIEHFRNLFKNAQFLAKAANLLDAPLIKLLQPRLDVILRDYRTPAVHGAEPVSAVKVQELRTMLLGNSKDDGLLSSIVELCK